MVRCNVSGNSALEEADEGGGIYIEGTAALSLTDTEVSHNSAGVGGGVYATGGVNVQLSNVRMTGNVATVNSASNDLIRGSSTVERCSAGECIFNTECQSCNAPVGPAPAISPTAAPTAPTMAPTGTPTVPPTRAPATSAPSPGPTASPSFHPCTDGSHDCDTGTTYCAIRLDVVAGFTCECNAGLTRVTSTACVRTANPSGAPTTSGPSLAPTTSTPSVRPTTSPTPAPSLFPTVYPTIAPADSPTEAPASDGSNGDGAESAGSKASDAGDDGSAIIVVVVVALLLVIGVVVGAGLYLRHQVGGSDRAAAGFDNPMYAGGPSVTGAGGDGQASQPELSRDKGLYSSTAPPNAGGSTGYMDVSPAQPVGSSSAVGYMDVAPTQGYDDDDDAEDV